MIEWIDRWLDSRSNPEAIFHGALGLALVAFLHYETDPELGFSIFYVIPVFALTWPMERSGRPVISTAARVSVQVEVYMKDHADIDVTHGICPDCVSEHYPGHAHGGRSAG